MAVKIRLRRMGAKKSPFYRVVVADSRYPRDGRFIEQLGFYDPTKNPSVVSIDLENAKKWIANGAQPTDTVKRLLKIAENPVAENQAETKIAPKAEKAPEAPVAQEAEVAKAEAAEVTEVAAEETAKAEVATEETTEAEA